MKKLLISSLCLLTIFSPSRAQDARFSQFFASPLYLNPALAGSANNPGEYQGGRIGLNYRNQWSKLMVPFTTMSLYYDQNISQTLGSIGAIITEDIAGEGNFQTLNASAVYSYTTPFGYSGWAGRYGLQLGYQNSSVDFMKLRFQDQIDPTVGVVQPTSEIFGANAKGYFNSAVGAIFYNEALYFGGSMHNITEPTYTFYSDNQNIIPRRITAMAGAKIELNNGSYLLPSAVYMKQANFTDFNAGIQLSNEQFTMGTYYRRSMMYQGHADAISLTVGINRDMFAFGYTYDMTVSDLKQNMPISNEISLRFYFDSPMFHGAGEDVVFPMF